MKESGVVAVFTTASNQLVDVMTILIGARRSLYSGEYVLDRKDHLYLHLGCLVVHRCYGEWSNLRCDCESLQDENKINPLIGMLVSSACRLV